MRKEKELKKRLLGIFFFLQILISVSYGKSYIYYSVQLGAFLKHKDAKSFIDRVKKYFESLFEHKPFIYITDRKLITVRVGISKNKKDLKDILKLVKRKGFKNAYIVPTDIRKIRSRRSKNTAKRTSNIVKNIDKKTENRKQKQLKFWQNFKYINKELILILENIKSMNRRFPVIKFKDSIQISKLKRYFEEVIKLEDKKFYLTGSLFYRTQKFLTEDNTPTKFQGFLGFKINLFRNGIGESDYKKTKFKFEEFKYNVELGLQKGNLNLLENQIHLVEEFYLNEQNYINNLRRETFQYLYVLFLYLENLDKGFKSYRRLVEKDLELLRNVKITKNIGRKFIPIIDLNLNNLLKIIKSKKKQLEKELGLLTRKVYGEYRLLKILKDTELSFYMRYYLNNSGNWSDFFQIGISGEIPIPFSIKLRDKVYKLEIIRYKHDIMARAKGIYSNVIDYAIRLKQNNMHIKEHLKEIEKELINIEKELFLWREGIKSPDYSKIYKSYLEIFRRFDLINNYKFLNYMYFLRIINILNLNEKEIGKVFYGGI